INNVEPLAAVPPILTNGPAWYKKMSLASPKSTGTKLFSVCGHVQKPGNYELTMGFPLKDLLYELCGGMRPGRTLKACIPGGSSVPILDRAETEACLLDYEGAVAQGTMLGSGGVIVFDDSADMVYQIMRLARFYAHESCAQCTQWPACAACVSWRWRRPRNCRSPAPPRSPRAWSCTPSPSRRSARGWGCSSCC